MTEDFSDIELTLYSSTPTTKATILLLYVETYILCLIVVCLSVCLFATRKLHGETSLNFLFMLPIALACSSFGGVAISYVLPVLWMT